MLSGGLCAAISFSHWLADQCLSRAVLSVVLYRMAPLSIYRAGSKYTSKQVKITQCLHCGWGRRGGGGEESRVRGGGGEGGRVRGGGEGGRVRGGGGEGGRVRVVVEKGVE